MKLTATARRLLDALQAAAPDEAVTIGNRAKALAIKAGSEVVKKEHIEGAAYLAGDEFIGKGEPL